MENNYYDSYVAGKKAMLKQIKEDCCSICDNAGYCYEGGRSHECTIGMYIYWLEEGNDRKDYEEHYKDVVYDHSDPSDDEGEMERTERYEDMKLLEGLEK